MRLATSSGSSRRSSSMPGRFSSTTRRIASSRIGRFFSARSSIIRPVLAHRVRKDTGSDDLSWVDGERIIVRFEPTHATYHGQIGGKSTQQ